ncbi:MAG: bifunctional riboflavin kinase/FAD synthetase [Candidatus Omnitrophota bacterium]
MKIITDGKKIKLKRSSTVMVGVFDGVHTGHQKIINYGISRARKLGIAGVIVTFSPHPSKVIEPENTPPLLISLEHRLRIFEELGADMCLVVKFTRALSKLSAKEFVEKYLVGMLKIKLLVVGPRFYFGRYRDGDIHMLERLGRQYRFGVKQIGHVKHKGIAVSSTYIRWLISQGSLDEARKLLARPVSVLGTVTRGSALGRELGYPTANVNPHHEVTPPPGVYAVKIKYDNKLYAGILNIGFRPTFVLYKSEPSIEVHIFNFNKKIYGHDLEIYFVKKLRNERKFLSHTALIAQIRKDEKFVRSILKI